MLLGNEIKSIKVPVRFIVDFESAIVNTLAKSFECTISGCYFHFVQSKWRNVLFNSDSSGKLAYRRIMSLPFIKVKHVVKAFKLIVKEVPISFKEYIDYFDEYYIGKLDIGSNSMRTGPNYPRELGNVYDQTLSGVPRTNISLESWHKQFA